MSSRKSSPTERLFESLFGCCVCATKTSSVRFQKSSKYEAAIMRCFKLQERRSGEICLQCIKNLRGWLKTEFNPRTSGQSISCAILDPFGLELEATLETLQKQQQQEVVASCSRSSSRKPLIGRRKKTSEKRRKAELIKKAVKLALARVPEPEWETFTPLSWESVAPPSPPSEVSEEDGPTTESQRKRAPLPPPAPNRLLRSRKRAARPTECSLGGCGLPSEPTQVSRSNKRSNIELDQELEPSPNNSPNQSTHSILSEDDSNHDMNLKDQKDCEIKISDNESERRARQPKRPWPSPCKPTKLSKKFKRRGIKLCLGPEPGPTVEPGLWLTMGLNSPLTYSDTSDDDSDEDVYLKDTKDVEIKFSRNVYEKRARKPKRPWPSPCKNATLPTISKRRGIKLCWAPEPGPTVELGPWPTMGPNNPPNRSTHSYTSDVNIDQDLNLKSKNNLGMALPIIAYEQQASKPRRRRRKYVSKRPKIHSVGSCLNKWNQPSTSRLTEHSQNEPSTSKGVIPPNQPLKKNRVSAFKVVNLSSETMAFDDKINQPSTSNESQSLLPGSGRFENLKQHRFEYRNIQDSNCQAPLLHFLRNMSESEVYTEAIPLHTPSCRFLLLPTLNKDPNSKTLRFLLMSSDDMTSPMPEFVLHPVVLSIASPIFASQMQQLSAPIFRLNEKSGLSAEEMQNPSTQTSNCSQFRYLVKRVNNPPSTSSSSQPASTAVTISRIKLTSSETCDGPSTSGIIEQPQPQKIITRQESATQQSKDASDEIIKSDNGEAIKSHADSWRGRCRKIMLQAKLTAANRVTNGNWASQKLKHILTHIRRSQKYVGLVVTARKKKKSKPKIRGRCIEDESDEIQTSRKITKTDVWQSKRQEIFTRVVAAARLRREANGEVEGAGEVETDEDIEYNGEVEAYEDVEADGEVEAYENVAANWEVDTDEDAEANGEVEAYEDVEADGAVEADQEVVADASKRTSVEHATVKRDTLQVTSTSWAESEDLQVEYFHISKKILIKSESDVAESKENIDGCVDSPFWPSESDCPGTIFRGPKGKILLDEHFRTPCLKFRLGADMDEAAGVGPTDADQDSLSVTEFPCISCTSVTVVSIDTTD